MKYVSLLRGINVGGKKKIKMLELKILYESLGLSNVTTYIQSGNVIFESQDKNRTKLKQLIENKIESNYGFQVPVEIRSGSEIAQIIINNPFRQYNLETEGTKILITFLNLKPDKEKISSLLNKVKLPEKMVINDKQAYLYCPNGYGKSKLSNTFIEKQLEISATTRNWKSVYKLYELSK